MFNNIFIFFVNVFDFCTFRKNNVVSDIVLADNDVESCFLINNDDSIRSYSE